jgi:hypothetical protein
MNADKVNRWLTLGANIGVVIGLVLVAFQINQDADLTRAQLFSEATDSRREFNQGMMGSDPMRVVTKSIERPHELTLEELQIMDMYLIAAVNEVRRLELLQDTGLAADVDVEEAWYEEFRNGQIIGSPTDQRIRSVDPDFVVNYFERVLDRLGDESGQSVTRDKGNNE